MTTLALKYLRFADARHLIQDKYDVHTKECEILRVITTESLKGKPLRVRTLLDMSNIASPATIHKAMKSLIEKDLLKVNEDRVDGRIKYLAPTARAMKVFTEIGKRM